MMKSSVRKQAGHPIMISSESENDDQVRISVIIPCFNSAETIQKCLESVLTQTGLNFEVIAVNDGSSDNTPNILQGFAPRVHIIHTENQGACAARNTGLDRAIGDYVVFLDSDDEISAHMLSACVQTAERENADIVLSDQKCIGPDGSEHIKSFQNSQLDPKYLFSNWLNKLQVNGNSIIWRRRFLKEIGGWDTAVLINQDGEIMLRALLAAPTIGYAPHVFSIYHTGNPASLSSSKTETKLQNYLETLTKLSDMAVLRGFDPEPIADEMYGFCRMCFRIGYQDVGRQGVRMLKKRGAFKHKGSIAHRAMASMLGLERKVKLIGS